MIVTTLSFILTISLVSNAKVQSIEPDSVRHFAKWAPIEIPFTGPDSRGRGEPNPFAISLDVFFTSPSGRPYRVPGFFDGNGRGGLDGDVWPWLGGTPREAMANGERDARFDIAKLAQWRELFEYMQIKGVVPYLVLEDDSAWKGYKHERYYREIIARRGVAVKVKLRS